jgi:hypothetical protein
MTSGRLGAAFAALSLAVGCSNARIEVLIEPQPREVAAIGVEVFGGGNTSSLSLDAPSPGTGLHVALHVAPGEGVVTVRSRDAQGHVLLEGRRAFKATSSVVAVCPVALGPATAFSAERNPRGETAF